MSKISDTTVRLAIATTDYYRDFAGAEEIVDRYFPDIDVLEVLLATNAERTGRDNLIEALEILKQAVEEHTNR